MEELLEFQTIDWKNNLAVNGWTIPTVNPLM